MVVQETACGGVELGLNVRMRSSLVIRRGERHVLADWCHCSGHHLCMATALYSKTGLLRAERTTGQASCAGKLI